MSILSTLTELISPAPYYMTDGREIVVMRSAVSDKLPVLRKLVIIVPTRQKTSKKTSENSFFLLWKGTNQRKLQEWDWFIGYVRFSNVLVEIIKTGMDK